MNIVKDTTIQHSVEVLYSTYQSLFNDLGLISSNPNPTIPSSSTEIDQQFKPNLFHPYTQGNIDERFTTLQRLLETMKFTFSQYRQWEGDKDYQKLLTNQRQYAATNLKVKQMLKTNIDCTLLGKIHLDSISKEPHRKLSLLVCRLSETMNDLDYRYGSYSDLHELTTLSKLQADSIQIPQADQIFNCNISSSTFLLDIFIKGDASINEVKLVHISMATGEDKETDESINSELTNALRNNVKEFDIRLRRICQQDLLFRRFQHINLQQALQVLQDDFITISNRQKEQLQQLQLQHQQNANAGEGNASGTEVQGENDDIADEWLYSSGYGKIALDICGVKINYFTTLQQRLAEESGYSLTIDLEEGGVDNVYQLPLTSQLSLDTTTPGYFISQQQNTDETISSNVKFVAKLDPPVYFTIETMSELLACVGTECLPDITNIKNPNAMIENQLVLQQQQQQLQQQSSASTTPLTNGKSKNELQNDVNLFGETQRYFYTGSEYHPSIEVFRIPFNHCSQLLPMLQILRQQVVFNILYKSCFTSCPIPESEEEVQEQEVEEQEEEVQEEEQEVEEFEQEEPQEIEEKMENVEQEGEDMEEGNEEDQEIVEGEEEQYEEDEDYDSLVSGDMEDTDIPVFEVMVQPPYSISITFIQPGKMDFNSIDIRIAPGGHITATIDNPTDDDSIPPLCSNEYLSQLLNTSKSIPITFAYLFNSYQSTINEINANNNEENDESNMEEVEDSLPTEEKGEQQFQQFHEVGVDDPMMG